jgi:hypothetical protein
MIKLLVDEGYAYDFLSILHVKKLFFNNEKSKLLYNECSQFIENQIGQLLHQNILNSDEFKNLIDANAKTFEAVEKARYGKISAKKVDDLNMLRFKFKSELQNKFFPFNVFSESKS